MRSVCINWPRFWCAWFFYVHMNEYYGWNRTPQSPTECVTDGIFMLILALSFTRRSP